MVKKLQVTVFIAILGIWSQLLPHSSAESNKTKLPPVKHLKDLLITTQNDGTMCVLTGDGEIQNFKSFILKDPLRIVVDIWNVTHTFHSREFSVGSDEVARIRVGTHPDKVRLVYDIAEGLKAIPPYALRRDQGHLFFFWERWPR